LDGAEPFLGHEAVAGLGELEPFQKWFLKVKKEL
jgi:hypothetical protein